MNHIQELSNQELLNRIGALNILERETISDLVLHLAEIDRRKIYLDEGYSSLFSYCTMKLGYSEGAAMRRISAARCIQETPSVYLKLREGKFTLCSLAEASKALKVGNREEILKVTENKSKLEVQRIVAQILPPTPVKKDSIKVTTVELPPPAKVVFSNETVAVKQKTTVFDFNFQGDQELMELYNKAQVIIGRKPVAGIFKASLKEFVLRRDPKERAKRRADRKARVKEEGKRCRHVPVAARDQVFSRDDGRCTFVGANGERCSETHALQIDHVVPFALDGGHEISNLRLMCGGHNQLLAERIFG